MKIEKAIEILDPEKSKDGKAYVALSAAEYFEARKIAKSALEKQLNQNFVEVVRCKDCKMFHKEDSGEKWCGRFDGGIGSDEDGYCSYGEQKDNQPERYVSAAGCMGPEYR